MGRYRYKELMHHEDTKDAKLFILRSFRGKSYFENPINASKANPASTWRRLG